MTDHTTALLKILEIGHETSLRGRGVSLQDALRNANYKALRPNFASRDLLPLIAAKPDIIEQWVLYSADKRTAGGWYLLEDGQIGQVESETTPVHFASLEEAVAEYVVRELDFWSSFD